MIPLSWYLIAGAALLCLGLFGLWVHREPVLVFLSVALLINAGVVTIVAFARYVEPVAGGRQLLALSALLVGGAQALVGAALVVRARRRGPGPDADLDLLQGEEAR